MSRKLRSFPILSVLILLTMIVAACTPQTIEVEVTREVEVEVEVITEVEVTREVEVEVETIVEVEVPVGGELVTIVARCRAKPPTEDWRCNNLLFGVADVNADLEAAGDSRRVVVKTIQDNTGFGDIMQEFALAFESGEAPDIVLVGHEFIGTEVEWIDNIGVHDPLNALNAVIDIHE